MKTFAGVFLLAFLWSCSENTAPVDFSTVDSNAIDPQDSIPLTLPPGYDVDSNHDVQLDSAGAMVRGDSLSTGGE
jgi:hypothetical protein